MDDDPDSPRRRDVLRGSAAAGLAAFGWSAGGVSARDQTTTEQNRRSQNAFSYSLQEGDRFRVLSPLRTPDGESATERIPPECGDERREFAVFVVRAFRNSIRLGYEGLLVPQQAVETATTGTTTAEETTVEGTTTVVNETTTPSETDGAGNATARPTAAATTEAPFQDETTTESTNETPSGDPTTTLANETTAGNGTETTAGNETETTTTTTAETTTTTGAAALPPIRVGEWYRVASMSKCDSLARMSLEPAEPRTES